MLNSTTLQSIGIVIASVAAIAGLAGLIVQLRLVIRSTESQVYQGLIANSLKIDEILLERPHLRKYIYDRAPVPPADVSPEELESFVELVVDVVDNLRIQERYIPDDARKGWREFTVDLLGQPAVITFLQSRGHWYSGLLAASIEPAENGLAAESASTDQPTSPPIS